MKVVRSGGPSGPPQDRVAAGRELERQQFRLLMRNALRRLLNAAVLARDTDPAQFAIWITAIVATPPSMFAFSQMFKYAVAARTMPPEAIERLLLGDRAFFIVYGMVAAGLLAAMTWEALFPDRTDQEIVGVLPVRPRTLAAAKLSAAMIMALAFATAITLPAAALFGLSAMANPLLVPVMFLAHLVAGLSACMCVFTLLLLVRGVVGVIFGADHADRLALVLQLLAVIGIVEVFFYLPTVLPMVIERVQHGGNLDWLTLPASHLALYSWLAGAGIDDVSGGAIAAVLTLLVPLLAVISVYLLPGGLMARRALESQPGERAGWPTRALRMTTLPLRDARSRAVAQFALTSIARSRRHVLVVATYAGFGIAIAAIALVAARLRVGLIAPAPTASILAVPLVMIFFLSLGLRAAFRIPTELDANWAFRLLPPSPAQAAAGTRFALMVLVVVPVCLSFAGFAWFAGWRRDTIVTVAVLDAASGFMLIEALLIGWQVIPFACAHTPSIETMKSRWLFYLIPLNVFAFRAASAQTAALGHANGPFLYLIVVLGTWLVVRRIRLRSIRNTEIAFDTAYEQQLGVLNLSGALS